MQLGGGRDADGVQLVQGEQILVPFEQVRDVVFLAQLLEPVGLEAGDADYLDSRKGEISAQRGLAGEAEADYTDAEGLLDGSIRGSRQVI